MGFHICEYCTKDGEHTPATSSGDVNMTFENGRAYVAPDMLTHYVERHGYLPPESFVDDVLNQPLIAGGRQQTRSIQEPEPVGYLAGEYNQGLVPPLFLEKLQRVMELAAQLDGRTQTKGLTDGGPTYRG